MKEKMKNFTSKTKETFSLISKKMHDSFFYVLSHYDFYLCLVVVTVLAIILRIRLFDCVKGDFSSFLKPWYTQIYNNGISSLGASIGDYTPAYYYLLWMISWFRFDPESIKVLYGIKTISCIFDLVLSIFAYLIIKEITSNKQKGLIAYIGIQFGITVFLNSSLWGQCDVIYTAFIVISLYYLLKGKPRTAFIFYGCSFAFKLQAIFVLPVYIILYFRKQIKFRYFFIIPLVYLVFALPSAIISNNFFHRLGEIFAVYINQSTNSYQQVTLNAGTLYSLFFLNFTEEKYISAFAVPLAIAVIGSLIYFIYRSKTKFTNKTYVKIATLFALAFPYLLPHMHERYYYVADVLVIIYIILNPKKFYVAICAILNSLIGYMSYLWGLSFIPLYTDNTRAASFRFGSLIYLVAIFTVAIDLFKEIYPNGLEDNNKEEEPTYIN